MPAAQKDTGPVGAAVPAAESRGGAALADAALDVTAAQTACQIILDAAQHVRRTTIAAEAATVAALTQSLTAAGDNRDWARTLEAAQQSVQGAAGVFTQMSAAAIEVVKAARQAR